MRWRQLSPDDVTGLAALDRAVKEQDGEETVSDLVGEALSADGSVCIESGSTLVGVGWGTEAMLGGRVDPAFRRRGLGTQLLAWTLARAPAGELTIRTEALTADADTIYRRQGFACRFAEDRMERDLSGEVAVSRLPAEVEMHAWTTATAGAFFAAYRGSFAGRPGFPDPAPADWIGGHDPADGFEPRLSRVAVLAGTPVAFVTVERERRFGWIDQMGVVPAWRRRGLGAAVLAQALAGLRAEGVSRAALHVNVNNPEAAALYARMGFERRLQRARYVRPVTA
jgi:ribosomal protein S18 acetylase RimI-like enzyme